MTIMTDDEIARRESQYGVQNQAPAPEQAGHLQEQDLIEEMAKAMYVRPKAYWSLPWDQLSEQYRADLREQAKYALAVLRKRHLLTEQAIEILGEGE